MVARTRSQASEGGDSLLKMSKSVKPGNYKIDDNEMSDWVLYINQRIF